MWKGKHNNIYNNLVKMITRSKEHLTQTTDVKKCI